MTHNQGLGIGTRKPQKNPHNTPSWSLIFVYLLCSLLLGKLLFCTAPHSPCLKFKGQTCPGLLSSNSKFKGDSLSQLSISLLISYNQRGKVLQGRHGPNVYMNGGSRGEPSGRQWPWGWVDTAKGIFSVFFTIEPELKGFTVYCIYNIHCAITLSASEDLIGSGCHCPSGQATDLCWVAVRWWVSSCTVALGLYPCLATSDLR